MQEPVESVARLGRLNLPGEPPEPSPDRSATRQMPNRLVRAVLAVAAALIAGVAGRVLLSDAGAVTLEVDAAAGGASAASSGLAQPTGTRSPAPDAAASGAAATATPSWSGPDGAAGSLVVHVVGKVRRPGLVTLAPGDRVADAVAAAGGATGSAALSRINLARRPVDGEQIVVPGPDDPVPPVAAGAPADGTGSNGLNGTGGGPLDLNAATQADLEELPGIGPVTAGRILAWRQAHQRFSRVDELGEVAGIGPKTLAQLRPLVRV